MKKTIEDIPVGGKRVFVRVDFNVPVENGEITDETRIERALPTLNYLVEHGAKVIVASHLGRPKGQVKPEMRMAPVAESLSKLVDAPVKMSAYDNPGEALPEVEALAAGELLLLENLRFHPGEEENGPEFAQALAAMADVYVNDAFGTAHRAHASTYGIAREIKGGAVAGFLMARELAFLGESVETPKRPFVVVIGGAKVSDKIGVLDRLMTKADKILIGGGMANTFLYAKDYYMGDSFVEKEAVEEARELLQKAIQRGVEIHLPDDLTVAEALVANAAHETVPSGQVPKGKMALDIGTDTIDQYSDYIHQAATVVMNGPMGVFETPPFDKGTVAIVKSLAECQGTTIVGGGDSVAAVTRAGVSGDISHVSTGGGASLKFLEGKTLPGVEVLQNKDKH